MWILNTRRIVLLLFILVVIAKAQEDSLRSALNAVDRRQRDLTIAYPSDDEDRYFYSSDNKENLAFLKPSENIPDDSRSFERALAHYLEENEDLESSEPVFNQNIMKKRFSSSFRERIENDKTKQREELAETLLNKLENSHEYNNRNEEYINLMNKLSRAYNDVPENYESAPRVFMSKEMKKRVYPGEYYTNLGYSSIGLKKRSRYYEPDGPSEPLYLVNYAPKDDIFERLREEDLQSSDWNAPDVKHEIPYTRPYSMKKRFFVKKRSNPGGAKLNKMEKRSSKRNIRNLATTDPKVVKELSNVFGSPPVKSEGRPKKVVKRNNFNQTDLNSGKKVNETTKEVVPNITTDNSELKIEKKSINWEDYFGYDRKKKSDADLDQEWLMERYHKAVAMATKRSTDEDKDEKKSGKIDEHKKLQDMDTKLKYIEDSIVDDALKYTGAHEGATDSEEIQQIKNKVISRLSAAYNLEKMRQALGEYKKSIEKQKLQMKELGGEKLHEKRVSVARKQAVDEDRENIPEGDNNIKCALEGEDCDEQTYKTPKEIVGKQSLWTRGECPKIERVCNEVSEVLGAYSVQLQEACSMHQACLLCGANSWFAPTRECNVLFIAKADELCEDDRECQQIARHSVRYLLDLNRSLRGEPADGCDLICSEDRL